MMHELYSTIYDCTLLHYNDKFVASTTRKWVKQLQINYNQFQHFLNDYTGHLMFINVSFFVPKNKNLELILHILPSHLFSLPAIPPLELHLKFKRWRNRSPFGISYGLMVGSNGPRRSGGHKGTPGKDMRGQL